MSSSCRSHCHRSSSACWSRWIISRHPTNVSPRITNLVQNFIQIFSFSPNCDKWWRMFNLQTDSNLLITKCHTLSLTCFLLATCTLTNLNKSEGLHSDTCYNTSRFTSVVVPSKHTAARPICMYKFLSLKLWQYNNIGSVLEKLRPTSADVIGIITTGRAASFSQLVVQFLSGFCPELSILFLHLRCQFSQIFVCCFCYLTWIYCCFMMCRLWSIQPALTSDNAIMLTYALIASRVDGGLL